MMARATVRAIISKWKKKLGKVASLPKSSRPSKMSQITAITYPTSHIRPKENIEGTADLSWINKGHLFMTPLCKRHWAKIAFMELWKGENYWKHTSIILKPFRIMFSKTILKDKGPIKLGFSIGFHRKPNVYTCLWFNAF